jgi:DNA-binding XRE family transcriptional regulator
VRTFSRLELELLSNRLREIRESVGLTVAELAELSGIAESTIYGIEREDRVFRVNYKVAVALASALYVQVSKIFDLEDLSPLGRPPFTGIPNRAPYMPAANTPVSPVCPHCNLELPYTLVCDIHGDLSSLFRDR